jgi:nucleoside-diphosphate-sugar epimerase
LLCRGDEVVVVDNFLTGRRENLAHLATHPRLHVRNADVCSAPERFARLAPCERVYHLASPASTRPQ